MSSRARLLVDCRKRPTYGGSSGDVRSVQRRHYRHLGKRSRGNDHRDWRIAACSNRPLRRRLISGVTVVLTAAALAAPAWGATVPPTSADDQQAEAATTDERTTIFSLQDVLLLGLGSVVAVGIGVAFQRAVREPS